MTEEWGRRQSAFYAHAYLLQSAEFLWRAAVAEKRTYPLPEHELNATLYAAFAAEAYINTAMDLVLGPEEGDALSSLRVKDRWTLGTRMAFGAPVLQPGEEPHQTLVALFRERNRLVHARSHTVEFFDSDTKTHDDVPTVARYLLRVSQAADRLGAQAPEVAELRTVPGVLLGLDHQLSRFEPDHHADNLKRVLRRLRVVLAEREFGTVDELVEHFGDDEADLYWTRELDAEETFPDD